MSPKTEILALLPKLSSVDLDEVQTAVKFAGTLAGMASAPEQSSDWVLAGIAAHLARCGMLQPQGALQALRRRDTYKGYAAKLAQLAPFLARLEASAGTVSRHRPRLGVILAEALAEWLEMRSMLSVSAMLLHLDKIPEALDASYPGYVSAGLFGMLLRMEK